MSTTTLYMSPKCLEKFREDFHKKKFSQEDIIVLKTWNLEMERFGHNYIFESHEWRDQPLKNRWKDHRVSFISTNCKAIYRIINKTDVEVCKIEMD